MTSPNTGLTDTPGGIRVPAAIAQQLISTYKAEEGWPPDKTRAVWFSRDSIIDIQALIDENDGDGIRIYFGKYPSDVDVAGTPDPAYKGKVTLVFIPTLPAGDGSHQDLFSPTTASPADDGGEGYDHGGLCPPNCGQTPPPPPTNP